MKFCSKCKIEKDELRFNKNQRWCKDCVKLYNTIYYQNNKEDILNDAKVYNQNNKEKKKEYDKLYRQDNKLEIVERQQKWYQENIDHVKEYDKIYYDTNKEDILSHGKIYRQNNKDQRNAHERKRKKDDPIYRIRRGISNSIGQLLKKIGLNKNNTSCLTYLPFTLEDLKRHIEKQFELPSNEWMNWNNQGKYIKEAWDDNDPKTWTWQIDHIIPHSTFKYTSMDSQEFRDCWALSNLRPLSAKQNQLDGANKTRHTRKNK